MGKASRPRKGSLQYWPRKRAAKPLHRINFAPIYHHHKEEGILGFIAYKAGMATAIVKDNTEKVMTSKKTVATAATVLEVPSMKVFSVRFYKHAKVLTEIVVSNDKELKRKLKVPKTAHHDLHKAPAHYDDVRVLVYSMPKQTSLKKTPDLIELAVHAKDKLEYIKGLIGKEITIADFLKYKVLDVRGLTVGKGLQGPVKRFGLTLKFHKSEKGQRRPGSLGPWHPARVMFRVPMAGQMGYFSRIAYNNVVLGSGKISDKNINPVQGFKDYGNIQTSYVIIKGSVPGPRKRQLLLTPPLRPTKEQNKKKMELLEVVA